ARRRPPRRPGRIALPAGSPRRARDGAPRRLRSGARPRTARRATTRPRAASGTDARTRAGSPPGRSRAPSATAGAARTRPVGSGSACPPRVHGTGKLLSLSREETVASITTGESLPREDPRDLGFGGRVAERAGARFLNRDGTFNVYREG